MSGVFLSYSRADRVLALRVLGGLRVLGVEVWWDEDMPGVDWQEELERQISQLAGIVVLWTAASTNSKNVRDEARLGLHLDKLVNVQVGGSKPPFPYDRVNSLPLDGWTEGEPHNGWTRLVKTVEALMVKAGAAQAGQISGALARREQDIRLAREALTQAEEAFQAAQTQQAEATQALAEAQAEFARSEEQLQRVVALRASAAVVRAAQQDREDGDKARSQTQADVRAASEALSLASRALAQAKARLQAMLPSESGAPQPPDASESHAGRREARADRSVREAPRPARRIPLAAAMLAGLLAIGAGAIWLWLAQPTNRIGLTIEDTRVGPSLKDGHAVLAIAGAIRNITGRVIAPPPLRVTLFDGHGQQVGSEVVNVAGAGLQPGATELFQTDYVDPPFSASDVQIQFVTNAEAGAAGTIGADSGPTVHAQLK